MKSSSEMKRDSSSSDRMRNGREVAIAMSNQSSKTIRFICGACAQNVYANRGLLFRTQNLSSPLILNHDVKSAPSAFHKHTQQAPSFLVSGALGFRMPRTYRHCACSRGSGKPSTSRQRDSTYL